MPALGQTDGLPTHASPVGQHVRGEPCVDPEGLEFLVW